MSDLDFSVRTDERRFLDFDEGKEKEWNGSFFFVQGADTQFGMMDSYFDKKPEPKWDREMVLANKLVAAVNRMNPLPRFLVICGDLLDAFPDLNGELRRAQEKDFKEIFAKVDPRVPLVCVCGNHDVGQTPTVQTVRSYRDSFGDDYFSFWCGGVLFLALNSQYYFDSSLVPELAAEQDAWLDGLLSSAAASGCKHLVVFQHIPWFLYDANEPEDGVFTVEPRLRLKMLDKLKAAGVRAVFCGHYHRNAGGFYQDLEVVVTSAVGGQLGSDPHGVRIVRVHEDRIRHRYVGLDDLPEVVEL